MAVDLWLCLLNAPPPQKKIRKKFLFGANILTAARGVSLYLLRQSQCLCVKLFRWTGECYLVRMPADRIASHRFSGLFCLLIEFALVGAREGERYSKGAGDGARAGAKLLKRCHWKAFQIGAWQVSGAWWIAPALWLTLMALMDSERIVKGSRGVSGNL